jgi:hypothetical protein
MSDYSKHITAYNVRRKEKGRPILNAVISRTTKGAYLVQGRDDNGDKLTTLVNKEKAEKAVAVGVAVWAEETNSVK